MGQVDQHWCHGLEHFGLEAMELRGDLVRLRNLGAEVFETRETSGARMAFVKIPASVPIELIERKRAL